VYVTAVPVVDMNVNGTIVLAPVVVIEFVALVVEIAPAEVNKAIVAVCVVPSSAL
jgi:hypothetical protein